MTTITETACIRDLNDELRRFGRGGQVTITRGVAALSAPTQQAALIQLRQFDRFDADNDPHQEHDFGSFVIGAERLFFKIDCYDRSCRLHSPDPADPAVTCRVLTLMLADEY